MLQDSSGTASSAGLGSSAGVERLSPRGACVGSRPVSGGDAPSTRSRPIGGSPEMSVASSSSHLVVTAGVAGMKLSMLYPSEVSGSLQFGDSPAVCAKIEAFASTTSTGASVTIAGQSPVHVVAAIVLNTITTLSALAPTWTAPAPDEQWPSLPERVLFSIRTVPSTTEIAPAPS